MPKTSGGICIINDLSWPIKNFIKEFVSPDGFSLTYMSVDLLVWHIQLFDDPYISKQGKARAFTHSIVHSSNWHLLGLKWQNKCYISMFLVFSCHSSPFIFNKFSDIPMYMSQNKGK